MESKTLAGTSPESQERHSSWARLSPGQVCAVDMCPQRWNAKRKTSQTSTISACAMRSTASALLRRLRRRMHCSSYFASLHRSRSAP
eukprot:5732013-Pyramimonas_sp.AAC.1